MNTAFRLSREQIAAMLRERVDTVDPDELAPALPGKGGRASWFVVANADGELYAATDHMWIGRLARGRRFPRARTIHAQRFTSPELTQPDLE